MAFVGIDQAIYGLKDMALGRCYFTDWDLKKTKDTTDRGVWVDKRGMLTRARRGGARRAVKFR